MDTLVWRSSLVGRQQFTTTVILLSALLLNGRRLRRARATSMISWKMRRTLTFAIFLVCTRTRKSFVVPWLLKPPLTTFQVHVPSRYKQSLQSWKLRWIKLMQNSSKPEVLRYDIDHDRWHPLQTLTADGLGWDRHHRVQPPGNMADRYAQARRPRDRLHQPPN